MEDSFFTKTIVLSFKKKKINTTMYNNTVATHTIVHL
jgi:hypothetical protein